MDDLAIEGGPGEVPEVVAILAGPGYWGQRAGWIGRLAGWVGGGGKVRVDVERGGEDRLGRPAEAGRDLTRPRAGDDRLRPYLEKIPGAGR